MSKTNGNWRKFETGCDCDDLSGNKTPYVCLKCQKACCELAEEVSCVCLYSYRCVVHSPRAVCYGSHS